MTPISNLPSLDFGKSNLAFMQAQFAQLAKSAMTGWQDLGQMQDNAGTKLLHVFLDGQSPAASLTMKNLLGLPFGLASDLAAQQKDAVESLIQRHYAMIEDLRNAAGNADISLVLNGYMNDIEHLMRNHGSKVMNLMHSASASTTALTERTLDDMIAAAPQKRLPSPG